MIDQSHLLDREEKLKALATYLHSLDCHDTDCRWGYESWVFSGTDTYNPSYCKIGSPSSKEKFYDKAEKLYNYFGSFAAAKKVVDFMTSLNPNLAKSFIDSLSRHRTSFIEAD